MSSAIDPLNIVDEYWTSLLEATQSLDKDERDELLSTVRAHIDEAVASGTITSVEDARQLIGAIGVPEDLVGAWKPGTIQAGDPFEARRVVRWLTLGSLIPLIGWLVGVSRLWGSHSWSYRDKIIGTVCFPGGFWGVIATLSGIGSAVNYVCIGGSYGRTEEGIVVDSTEVALQCVSEGLPLWAFWILAGIVLLAAVFGPVWVMMKWKLAADRPQG